MEPREAVRKTYLIEDFSRWDDAVYEASCDFHSTYARYPSSCSVHPSALSRFGARADPDKLQDEEGLPPEEGELDGFIPKLCEFGTAEFVVRFVPEPALWPVELVMWSAPEGTPCPAEDTPPGPAPNHLFKTNLKEPLCVRAKHARLLPIAEQCCTCKNILTISSCCAFPDGIPFPIAASLFDHRRPFEGDGGLQRKRSRFSGGSMRATYAMMFDDESTLIRPKDGPKDPPEPHPPAAFGDDSEAPKSLDKEEARARAKPALRALVEEAGGPHEIDGQALCEAFEQAYPLSYALLREGERPDPLAYQAYIKRWLGAQRRRKIRPKPQGKLLQLRPS